MKAKSLSQCIQQKSAAALKTLTHVVDFKTILSPWVSVTSHFFLGVKKNGWIDFKNFLSVRIQVLFYTLSQLHTNITVEVRTRSAHNSTAVSSSGFFVLVWIFVACLFSCCCVCTTLWIHTRVFGCLLCCSSCQFTPLLRWRRETPICLQTTFRNSWPGETRVAQLTRASEQVALNLMMEL